MVRAKNASSPVGLRYLEDVGTTLYLGDLRYFCVDATEVKCASAAAGAGLTFVATVSESMVRQTRKG